MADFGLAPFVAGFVIGFVITGCIGWLIVALLRNSVGPRW